MPPTATQPSSSASQSFDRMTEPISPLSARNPTLMKHRKPLVITNKSPSSAFRTSSPSSRLIPNHEKWTSRLATPGLDHSQIKVTDHRLGAGSYGQVCLGLYLGSPVAIKVCPLQRQEGISSSKHTLILEHFCREVARYQKIRHHCILSYYGVVFDDNALNLYLVTELMRGGSLFHCLQSLREQRFTHLPFASILKVASQISNGLYYLHRQNFTSGDLKSLNILLNSAPDLSNGSFAPNVQVKLCDFGLSKNVTKLLKQLSRNGNVSPPKGVHGSYAYLPPESFSTSTNETVVVDAKAADIYALAVVFWELATLQVPWKGRNPLQVVKLVGKEGLRPKWPEETLQNVPQSFIDLTNKCWHQNPKFRPSAMEVSQMLGKLMSSLK